jgi:hypothetical protein
MLEMMRVLFSIALRMRDSLCLTSQKAHRKNEAEAPKDHDMQSKAKQRRRNNQHDTEQFTGIVKTFEKIQNKLSSSAAGKAALNSGQDWESQTGISLQLAQGCASIAPTVVGHDLRILSRLVSQSAIPECGPR